MKTDVREYTLNEVGKAITVMEIHLKQMADDSVFCDDCSQKHFLEIQKFAEEGAGFFPENKRFWEDLENWAKGSARKIILSKSDPARLAAVANQLFEEARERRKAIVAMLEEEVLNQLLLKTIHFIKNDNKAQIYKLIFASLVASPQIVKTFTEEMSKANYISNFDRNQIIETVEFLVKFKFHQILVDALMKAPLTPGSQKIIFSSIESYGLNMVNNLFSSEVEKDNMKKKITQLSQDIKEFDLQIFCPNIIKRKSLDIFYQGIKSAYKKEYEIAFNKFLIALKLYRDNFLYYWNLAKTLANLNLRQKAILYYKRTIRLLNLTKVPNKSLVREDIKLELNSIKKQKTELREIKPLLSLDKYQSNKLS